MLDGSSLRAFNTWCGVRDLSWSAAAAVDGCDVMMLTPRGPVRAWQRMVLIMDDSEFRLENEVGETLASASDLPALLDAVDGGVAEDPPAPVRVLASLSGDPTSRAMSLVV